MNKIANTICEYFKGDLGMIPDEQMVADGITGRSML